MDNQIGSFRFEVAADISKFENSMTELTKMYDIAKDHVEQNKITPDAPLENGGVQQSMSFSREAANDALNNLILARTMAQAMPDAKGLNGLEKSIEILTHGVETSLANLSTGIYKAVTKASKNFDAQTLSNDMRFTAQNAKLLSSDLAESISTLVGMSSPARKMLNDNIGQVTALVSQAIPHTMHNRQSGMHDSELVKTFLSSPEYEHIPKALARIGIASKEDQSAALNFAIKTSTARIFRRDAGQFDRIGIVANPKPVTITHNVPLTYQDSFLYGGEYIDEKLTPKNTKKSTQEEILRTYRNIQNEIRKGNTTAFKTAVEVGLIKLVGGKYQFSNKEDVINNEKMLDQFGGLINRAKVRAMQSTPEHFTDMFDSRNQEKLFKKENQVIREATVLQNLDVRSGANPFINSGYKIPTEIRYAKQKRHNPELSIPEMISVPRMVARRNNNGDIQFYVPEETENGINFVPNLKFDWRKEGVEEKLRDQWVKYGRSPLVDRAFKVYKEMNPNSGIKFENSGFGYGFDRKGKAKAGTPLFVDMPLDDFYNLDSFGDLIFKEVQNKKGEIINTSSFKDNMADFVNKLYEGEYMPILSSVIGKNEDGTDKIVNQKYRAVAGKLQGMGKISFLQKDIYDKILEKDKERGALSMLNYFNEVDKNGNLIDPETGKALKWTAGSEAIYTKYFDSLNKIMSHSVPIEEYGYKTPRFSLVNMDAFYKARNVDDKFKFDGGGYIMPEVFSSDFQARLGPAKFLAMRMDYKQFLRDSGLTYVGHEGEKQGRERHHFFMPGMTATAEDYKRFIKDQEKYLAGNMADEEVKAFREFRSKKFVDVMDPSTKGVLFDSALKSVAKLGRLTPDMYNEIVDKAKETGRKTSFTERTNLKNGQGAVELTPAQQTELLALIADPEFSNGLRIMKDTEGYRRNKDFWNPAYMSSVRITPGLIKKSYDNYIEAFKDFSSPEGIIKRVFKDNGEVSRRVKNDKSLIFSDREVQYRIQSEMKDLEDAVLRGEFYMPGMADMLVATANPYDTFGILGEDMMKKKISGKAAEFKKDRFILAPAVKSNGAISWTRSPYASGANFFEDPSHSDIGKRYGLSKNSAMFRVSDFYDLNTGDFDGDMVWAYHILQDTDDFKNFTNRRNERVRKRQDERKILQKKLEAAGEGWQKDAVIDHNPRDFAAAQIRGNNTINPIGLGYKAGEAWRVLDLMEDALAEVDDYGNLTYAIGIDSLKHAGLQQLAQSDVVKKAVLSRKPFNRLTKALFEEFNNGEAGKTDIFGYALPTFLDPIGIQAMALGNEIRNAGNTNYGETLRDAINANVLARYKEKPPEAQKLAQWYGNLFADKLTGKFQITSTDTLTEGDKLVGELQKRVAAMAANNPSAEQQQEISDLNSLVTHARNAIETERKVGFTEGNVGSGTLERYFQTYHWENPINKYGFRTENQAAIATLEYELSEMARRQAFHKEIDPLVDKIMEEDMGISKDSGRRNEILDRILAARQFTGFNWSNSKYFTKGSVQTPWSVSYYDYDRFGKILDGDNYGKQKEYENPSLVKSHLEESYEAQQDNEERKQDIARQILTGEQKRSHLDMHAIVGLAGHRYMERYAEILNSAENKYLSNKEAKAIAQKAFESYLLGDEHAEEIKNAGIEFYRDSKDDNAIQARLTKEFEGNKKYEEAVNSINWKLRQANTTKYHQSSLDRVASHYYSKYFGLDSDERVIMSEGQKFGENEKGQIVPLEPKGQYGNPIFVTPKDKDGNLLLDDFYRYRKDEHGQMVKSKAGMYFTPDFVRKNVKTGDITIGDWKSGISGQEGSIFQTAYYAHLLEQKGREAWAGTGNASEDEYFKQFVDENGRSKIKSLEGINLFDNTGKGLLVSNYTEEFGNQVAEWVESGIIDLRDNAKTGFAKLLTDKVTAKLKNRKMMGSRPVGAPGTTESDYEFSDKQIQVSSEDLARELTEELKVAQNVKSGGTGVKDAKGKFIDTDKSYLVAKFMQDQEKLAEIQKFSSKQKKAIENIRYNSIDSFTQNINALDEIFTEGQQKKIEEYSSKIWDPDYNRYTPDIQMMQKDFNANQWAAYELRNKLLTEQQEYVNQLPKTMALDYEGILRSGQDAGSIYLSALAKRERDISALQGTYRYNPYYNYKERRFITDEDEAFKNLPESVLPKDATEEQINKAKELAKRRAQQGKNEKERYNAQQKEINDAFLDFRNQYAEILPNIIEKESNTFATLLNSDSLDDGIFQLKKKAQRFQQLADMKDAGTKKSVFDSNLKNLLVGASENLTSAAYKARGMNESWLLDLIGADKKYQLAQLESIRTGKPINALAAENKSVKEFAEFYAKLHPNDEKEVQRAVDEYRHTYRTNKRKELGMVSTTPKERAQKWLDERLNFLDANDDGTELKLRQDLWKYDQTHTFSFDPEVQKQQEEERNRYRQRIKDHIATKEETKNIYRNIASSLEDQWTFQDESKIADLLRNPNARLSKSDYVKRAINAEKIAIGNQLAFMDPNDKNFKELYSRYYDNKHWAERKQYHEELYGQQENINQLRNDYQYDQFMRSDARLHRQRYWHGNGFIVRGLNQRDQQISIWQREKLDAENQISATQKRLDTLKAEGKEKTPEYSQAAQQLKNLQQVSANAGQAIDQLKSPMGTAGAMAEQFTQSISRLVSRFSYRFLMRTIQEIKTFVKQFDASMTSIQMITLKSDGQMSTLGDGLIKKAKELKVSIADITSSAETLYRQGLSDEEVNDRLDVVAKFSKVSGTKVDAATKLITVATKTGLVSDAMEAADIVTAIGDKAATNAAEIEKGIEKSAAAAVTDGTSFGQLVAMLTAITSTTQIGGNVAGRTINTIMARMNKIGTNEMVYDENGTAKSGSAIAKLIEQQGVDVYRNGKKRSSFDILYDLSKEWEGMDNAKQNQLASEIAGSRMYSNFAAIMQAMQDGDIDKYMDLIGDSEGITDKKYDIYTQSLAASLTDLQNAFDSLVQTLTDTGALTGFLNFLTGAISGVENLTKSFGSLGASLVTVIPMIAGIAMIKYGGLAVKAAGAVTLGAGLIMANANKQGETASERYQEITKRYDEIEKARFSGVDRLKELRDKTNRSTEEQEEYINLIQNIQKSLTPISSVTNEATNGLETLENAIQSLGDSSDIAADKILEEANEEKKKLLAQEANNLRGTIASNITEQVENGLQNRKEQNVLQNPYFTGEAKNVASVFTLDKETGKYTYSLEDSLRAVGGLMSGASILDPKLDIRDIIVDMLYNAAGAGAYKDINNGEMNSWSKNKWAEYVGGFAFAAENQPFRTTYKEYGEVFDRAFQFVTNPETQTENQVSLKEKFAQLALADSLGFLKKWNYDQDQIDYLAQYGAKLFIEGKSEAEVVEAILGEDLSYESITANLSKIFSKGYIAKEDVKAQELGLEAVGRNGYYEYIDPETGEITRYTLAQLEKMKENGISIPENLVARKNNFVESFQPGLWSEKNALGIASDNMIALLNSGEIETLDDLMAYINSHPNSWANATNNADIQRILAQAGYNAETITFDNAPEDILDQLLVGFYKNSSYGAKQLTTAEKGAAAASAVEKLQKGAYLTQDLKDAALTEAGYDNDTVKQLIKENENIDKQIQDIEKQSGSSRARAKRINSLKQQKQNNEEAINNLGLDYQSLTSILGKTTLTDTERTALQEVFGTRIGQRIARGDQFSAFDQEYVDTVLANYSNGLTDFTAKQKLSNIQKVQEAEKTGFKGADTEVLQKYLSGWSNADEYISLVKSGADPERLKELQQELDNLAKEYEIQIEVAGVQALENAGKVLSGTSQLLQDLQKNGTITLKTRMEFESGLHNTEQIQAKLTNGTVQEQIEAIKAITPLTDAEIQNDFTGAVALAQQYLGLYQNETAGSLGEIAKHDLGLANTWASRFGYSRWEDTLPEGYQIIDGRVYDSNGNLSVKDTELYKKNKGTYVYTGSAGNIEYTNPFFGLDEYLTETELADARKRIINGELTKDTEGKEKLFQRAASTMGQRGQDYMRMLSDMEAGTATYTDDELAAAKQLALDELALETRDTKKSDLATELQRDKGLSSTRANQIASNIDILQNGDTDELRVLRESTYSEWNKRAKALESLNGDVENEINAQNIASFLDMDVDRVQKLMKTDKAALQKEIENRTSNMLNDWGAVFTGFFDEGTLDLTDVSDLDGLIDKVKTAAEGLQDGAKEVVLSLVGILESATQTLSIGDIIDNNSTYAKTISDRDVISKLSGQITEDTTYSELESMLVGNDKLFEKNSDFEAFIKRSSMGNWFGRVKKQGKVGADLMHDLTEKNKSNETETSKENRWSSIQDMLDATEAEYQQNNEMAVSADRLIKTLLSGDIVSFAQAVRSDAGLTADMKNVLQNHQMKDLFKNLGFESVGDEIFYSAGLEGASDANRIALLSALFGLSGKYQNAGDFGLAAKSGLAKIALNKYRAKESGTNDYTDYLRSIINDDEIMDAYLRGEGDYGARTKLVDRLIANAENGISGLTERDKIEFEQQMIEDFKNGNGSEYTSGMRALLSDVTADELDQIAAGTPDVFNNVTSRLELRKKELEKLDSFESARSYAKSQYEQANKAALVAQQMYDMRGDYTNMEDFLAAAKALPGFTYLRGTQEYEQWARNYLNEDETGLAAGRTIDEAMRDLANMTVSSKGAGYVSSKTFANQARKAIATAYKDKNGEVQRKETSTGAQAIRTILGESAYQRWLAGEDIDSEAVQQALTNYAIGASGLSSKQRLEGIAEIRRMRRSDRRRYLEDETAEKNMRDVLAGWSNLDEYIALSKATGDEFEARGGKDRMRELNQDLKNFEKNAQIEFEVQGLTSLEEAGDLLEGTVNMIKEIKKGGKFEIEAVVNFTNKMFQEGQLDAMLTSGSRAQKAQAAMQITGSSSEQFYANEDYWLRKAEEEREAGRKSTGRAILEGYLALQTDQAREEYKQYVAAPAGYQINDFVLPEGYTIAGNKVYDQTMAEDEELTKAYRNRIQYVGGQTISQTNAFDSMSQKYNTLDLAQYAQDILNGNVTWESVKDDSEKVAKWNAAVNSMGYYSSEYGRLMREGNTEEAAKIRQKALNETNAAVRDAEREQKLTDLKNAALVSTRYADQYAEEQYAYTNEAGLSADALFNLVSGLELSSWQRNIIGRNNEDLNKFLIANPDAKKIINELGFSTSHGRLRYTGAIENRDTALQGLQSLFASRSTNNQSSIAFSLAQQAGFARNALTQFQNGATGNVAMSNYLQSLLGDEELFATISSGEYQNLNDTQRAYIEARLAGAENGEQTLNGRERNRLAQQMLTDFDNGNASWYTDAMRRELSSGLGANWETYTSTSSSVTDEQKAAALKAMQDQLGLEALEWDKLATGQGAYAYAGAAFKQNNKAALAAEEAYKSINRYAGVNGFLQDAEKIEGFTDLMASQEFYNLAETYLEQDKAGNWILKEGTDWDSFKQAFAELTMYRKGAGYTSVEDLAKQARSALGETDLSKRTDQRYGAAALKNILGESLYSKWAKGTLEGKDLERANQKISNYELGISMTTAQKMSGIDEFVGMTRAQRKEYLTGDQRNYMSQVLSEWGNFTNYQELLSKTELTPDEQKKLEEYEKELTELQKSTKIKYDVEGLQTLEEAGEILEGTAALIEKLKKGGKFKIEAEIELENKAYTRGQQRALLENGTIAEQIQTLMSLTNWDETRVKSDMAGARKAALARLEADETADGNYFATWYNEAETPEEKAAAEQSAKENGWELKIGKDGTVSAKRIEGYIANNVTRADAFLGRNRSYSDLELAKARAEIIKGNLSYDTGDYELYTAASQTGGRYFQEYNRLTAKLYSEGLTNEERKQRKYAKQRALKEEGLSEQDLIKQQRLEDLKAESGTTSGMYAYAREQYEQNNAGAIAANAIFKSITESDAKTFEDFAKAVKTEDVANWRELMKASPEVAKKLEDLGIKFKDDEIDLSGINESADSLASTLAALASIISGYTKDMTEADYQTRADKWNEAVNFLEGGYDWNEAGELVVNDEKARAAYEEIMGADFTKRRIAQDYELTDAELEYEDAMLENYQNGIVGLTEAQKYYGSQLLYESALNGTYNQKYGQASQDMISAYTYNTEGLLDFLHMSTILENEQLRAEDFQNITKESDAYKQLQQAFDGTSYTADQFLDTMQSVSSYMAGKGSEVLKKYGARSTEVGQKITNLTKNHKSMNAELKSMTQTMGTISNNQYYREQWRSGNRGDDVRQNIMGQIGVSNKNQFNQMSADQIEARIKSIEVDEIEDIQVDADAMSELMSNSLNEALQGEPLVLNGVPVTIGSGGVSLDFSEALAQLGSYLSEEEQAFLQMLEQYHVEGVVVVNDTGSGLETHIEITGLGTGSGGGGGGGGGKSEADKLIEDQKHKIDAIQHEINMAAAEVEIQGFKLNYKGETAAVDDQIKAQEKLRKQYQENIKEMKELMKRTEEGTPDWYKLRDSINAAEEAIKNTTKAIHDLESKKIQIIIERHEVIDTKNKNKQSMLDIRAQRYLGNEEYEKYEKTTQKSIAQKQKTYEANQKEIEELKKKLQDPNLDAKNRQEVLKKINEKEIENAQLHNDWLQSERDLRDQQISRVATDIQHQQTQYTHGSTIAGTYAEIAHMRKDYGSYRTLIREQQYNNNAQIEANNQAIESYKALLPTLAEGSEAYYKVRDAIYALEEANASLTLSNEQLSQSIQESIIEQLNNTYEKASKAYEHIGNIYDIQASMYEKQGDWRAQLAVRGYDRENTQRELDNDYDSLDYINRMLAGEMPENIKKQLQDEKDARLKTAKEEQSAAKTDYNEKNEAYKNAKAEAKEADKALKSANAEMQKYAIFDENGNIVGYRNQFDENGRILDDFVDKRNRQESAAARKKEADENLETTKNAKDQAKTALDEAKKKVKEIKDEVVPDSLDLTQDQLDQLTDKRRSIEEKIAKEESELATWDIDDFNIMFNGITGEYANQKKAYQHKTQMIQYDETKFKNAGELTNYGRAIEDENETQEDYIHTLTTQRTMLEQMFKLVKKGSPEYYKLKNAITELDEEIAKTNNAIDKNTKLLNENEEAIRKTTIAMIQEGEKQIKAQIKRERDMLAGTVSLQNTIIDSIKQRYQDEWNLAKKDIDRKKQALAEEKQLLNERLNARKEAISAEEKYEQLAELRRQLAMIESDSTRTKDAKELRKKISDIEKDIADAKATSEVQARSEEIDEATKAYDEMLQIGEQDLNDYLSNANNFAVEVEDILSGTYDEFIAWLEANNKAFALSLDEQQQQMINSWEDTWKKAKGITDRYWRDIEKIVNEGYEAENGTMYYGRNAWLEFRKTSIEYQEALQAGAGDEMKSLEYKYNKEFEDWYNAHIDNYSPSDISTEAPIASTAEPDVTEHTETEAWKAQIDTQKSVLSIYEQVKSIDASLKKLAGEPTKVDTSDTHLTSDKDVPATGGDSSSGSGSQSSGDQGGSGTSGGNQDKKFHATAIAAYYVNGQLVSFAGEGWGKTQKEADEAAMKDAKAKGEKAGGVFYAPGSAVTPVNVENVERDENLTSWTASIKYAKQDGTAGVATGTGIATTEQEAKEKAYTNAISKLPDNVEFEDPTYSKVYLHGGLVDYTGLAWVDGTRNRPEAFLDAVDTANIKALTEALNYISVAPMFVPSPDMFGGYNQTVGDINITINQAELNSDADLDQLAIQIGQRFTKELSKSGLNLNAYAF